MIKGQEVYTPQEVAELTDHAVISVYRGIREGKLKATKLGTWNIYRTDLAEALGIDPEILKQVDKKNKKKK